MTSIRIRLWISLIFFLWAASGCASVRVDDQMLPVAILGENYSSVIEADFSWAATSRSMRWTGGTIPSGMSLHPGGIVDGSPTEKGLFEFNVVGIASDESYTGDPLVDILSLLDYDTDAAVVTLLVTERSRNSSCPSPAAGSRTGISLCLGDLERATFEELFPLDVTLILPNTLFEDEEVSLRRLSFSISYDPAAILINAGGIGNGNLREATDGVEVAVSAAHPSEGVVRITLEAQEPGLFLSGRILDLPIAIITETPAEADFTLDLSDPDLSPLPTPAPEIHLVPGSL